MSSRQILIHTALLAEARPIIDFFDLKQYETRPFKVFRGRGIALVVSGVGPERTREVLTAVFEAADAKKQEFDATVNIGIAGCSDSSIPLGTLFCPYGESGGIPVLPLVSTETPCRREQAGFSEATLVDMEASAFLETVTPRLSGGGIWVFKVTSDYLSDDILSKDQVRRLIAGALEWIAVAVPGGSKLDDLMNISGYRRMHPADRFALWRTAREFAGGGRSGVRSSISSVRQKPPPMPKTARISFQELRLMIDMALDFRQWGEISLAEILCGESADVADDFAQGEGAFGKASVSPPVTETLHQADAPGGSPYKKTRAIWENLRSAPKSYRGFRGQIPEDLKKLDVRTAQTPPGLGRCPVESENTRCCRLSTLDVVEGCAFNCSYCAIRGFYSRDRITFHENLAEKLARLDLNPQKLYHIGTGQSSDSLMWGNRGGLLDDLLQFADTHPNVILELKTKAADVDYLASRIIPSNVLCTWSLNTPTIIENEEHGAADLSFRLAAARTIADKGNLVGFHFHPIVEYDGGREDYADVYRQVLTRFAPEEVTMVSFGTLTFTKPVIRALRERGGRSKVLQMPMSEIAGKFSYPFEVKKGMFAHAYRAFAEWHGTVFFYLCMEDVDLWEPCLEHSYPNNEAFESAMIQAYKDKIDEKRLHHR